ncbi:2-dehydropantoate 2-reductase [Cupriavidus basilensis]|uniref:2-dehydropantoate 2-reductase n=1 Tax=Cupriavidus basilensis TaxID=68895 RepID=A0ABT6AQH6_9BURK|nr:2-dehydropantoate 2-reductase [Cupriavidus basilensis]MDF3834870.1 2-dehydropantoate 2-reductase [Cupriavidus basilensis]
MTSLCIVGAGAVGGFIGARLARSGQAPNVLARGQTLSTLREQGLTLIEGGRTETFRVRAESDPAALGVQDVVILAVKAPALPPLAQTIGPLIGPETVVVTAMNGVPWWFFERPGPHAGLSLQTVDPEGAIALAIPAGQVIGCVVHLTASTPAPATVRHGFGARLILGAAGGAAGKAAGKVEAVASLLESGGLEVERSAAIQQEIWFKLWGNMTMNPVSVLTGATCDRILDDPLVNRFCLAVMAEAGHIGAAIGCPIAQSGEERSQVTRKLGAFKTSMLQDAEAGRPLEIDALVASVREIGQHVGIATPNIDALLGLVRLHAQVRGLY